MLSIFSVNNALGGFSVSFLGVAVVLSIAAAICVIITKNPVISVLFLIGLFMVIAVYLIMLGLKFLGLAYLLVYVGAVSILFLFILMLLNVRVSELVNHTRNTVPLVFVTTVCFNIPSNSFTQSGADDANDRIAILDRISLFSYDFLSKIYVGTWDNVLIAFDHINSIGNIMYTSHNVWLILVSVILLLAMVGTIVITLKDKDNTVNPSQPVSILGSNMFYGAIEFIKVLTIKLLRPVAKNMTLYTFLKLVLLGFLIIGMKLYMPYLCEMFLSATKDIEYLSNIVNRSVKFVEYYQDYIIGSIVAISVMRDFFKSMSQVNLMTAGGDYGSMSNIDYKPTSKENSGLKMYAKNGGASGSNAAPDTSKSRSGSRSVSRAGSSSGSSTISDPRSRSATPNNQIVRANSPGVGASNDRSLVQSRRSATPSSQSVLSHMESQSGPSPASAPDLNEPKTPRSPSPEFYENHFAGRPQRAVPHFRPGTPTVRDVALNTTGATDQNTNTPVTPTNQIVRANSPGVGASSNNTAVGLANTNTVAGPSNAVREVVVDPRAIWRPNLTDESIRPSSGFGPVYGKAEVMHYPNQEPDGPHSAHVNPAYTVERHLYEMFDFPTESIRDLMILSDAVRDAAERVDSQIDFNMFYDRYRTPNTRYVVQALIELDLELKKVLKYKKSAIEAAYALYTELKLPYASELGKNLRLNDMVLAQSKHFDYSIPAWNKDTKVNPATMWPPKQYYEKIETWDIDP